MNYPQVIIDGWFLIRQSTVIDIDYIIFSHAYTTLLIPDLRVRISSRQTSTIMMNQKCQS